MIETFPDIPILRRNHEATLNSLNDGELDDLRVDKKLEVDDIVEYGLELGLLKDILGSFPDPRKSFDIPIEILLLPQIIQRLNDEHSLLLAPFMLNSAKLLAKLGYNARVIEEGFNNKNLHEREAPFHGETLKHLLLSVKGDDLENWYNTKVNGFLKKSIAGRTRTYIMDGTYLKIPRELLEKYPGAGVVKDKDGNISCGYKIVGQRAD